MVMMTIYKNKVIIQAYLSFQEAWHILDILKHPEEMSFIIEVLDALKNFVEIKEERS